MEGLSENVVAKEVHVPNALAHAGDVVVIVMGFGVRGRVTKRKQQGEI